MADDVTPDEQPQQEELPVWEVPTSAQVERIYHVRAGDPDQAHARLRRHLEDPELLRVGIVTAQPTATKNTTPEKVHKERIGRVKDPNAPKVAGTVPSQKQTPGSGQKQPSAAS